MIHHTCDVIFNAFKFHRLQKKEKKERKNINTSNDNVLLRLSQFYIRMNMLCEYVRMSELRWLDGKYLLRWNNEEKTILYITEIASIVQVINHFIKSSASVVVFYQRPYSGLE